MTVKIKWVTMQVTIRQAKILSQKWRILENQRRLKIEIWLKMLKMKDSKKIRINFKISLCKSNNSKIDRLKNKMSQNNWTMATASMFNKPKVTRQTTWLTHRINNHSKLSLKNKFSNSRMKETSRLMVLKKRSKLSKMKVQSKKTTLCKKLRVPQMKMTVSIKMRQ